MWVAAMPVAAVTATHLLNSPPCRCRSASMMRFSRNDLPARTTGGRLAGGASDVTHNGYLSGCTKMSGHGFKLVQEYSIDIGSGLQQLACAGVAGKEDVLAFHHKLLHPSLRRANCVAS